MFLRVFYFTVLIFSPQVLSAEEKDSFLQECRQAVRSLSQSLESVDVQTFQGPLKELESLLSHYSIKNLGLSNRTENALINGEIFNLKILVQKTEAELLRVPNFGKKSLAEVKIPLSKMNLQLGMNLNLDESIKKLQPKEKPIPVLARLIKNLNLPARTHNTLKNNTVQYIGDLVTKTEEEVLRLLGSRKQSLAEIKGVLSEINLHLGMNFDWPLTREQVEELVKQLKSTEELNIILNRSLDILSLPAPIQGVLKNAWIEYIGDLAQRTEVELQQLGLRKKHLAKVNTLLSEIGLNLGIDIDWQPPIPNRLTLTTREEKFLKMLFGAERKNRHNLKEVGQTFNVKPEKVKQIRVRILHKLLSFGSSLLTSQEEKVLRMLFGIEEINRHTLAEVGRVLNMTREGIRQIKEKALHKLQRFGSSLLNPQEEKVLRMLFGIGEENRHTVTELEQIFGLTERRIQQIKGRALYKLRLFGRLLEMEDKDMESLLNPEKVEMLFKKQQDLLEIHPLMRKD